MADPKSYWVIFMTMSVSWSEFNWTSLSNFGLWKMSRKPSTKDFLFWAYWKEDSKSDKFDAKKNIFLKKLIYKLNN